MSDRPVRLPTIDLHTAAGELVVTVTVPPFVRPAEGIMWGQRFFALVPGVAPEPYYREGMLWWVGGWVPGGAPPERSGQGDAT